MKKYNITLGLLLLNIFLAFLGIGLIIPVMPSLINELGITGTTVGYLTATFAIAQLIVSPFAGKAVDSIGRKIVIVIGLFIFGISEFLFGIGQEVSTLFISRVLGGVSAAMIMPAVTAFIADITTMDNRPKAMGYMSAAISTGFIIGPGIGGILAEIGTRVPFFFAGGLGMLAGVLSIILLTEPERKAESSIVPTLERKNGLKKILAPLFFIPLILIFVISFGLAAFESFFSLYTDHKFHFQPKDIAIVIMGGSIIGALFQVVLFDWLVRIWGEIKLIRYCLIVSAVLVYFMTVVQSYWTIIFVTFTLFIGFDLFRPAVTSYLSNIAGNEQGFISGMNSMFTSLANICGPIIGGLLFDINIDYPYYFAAIVMVLGIMLSMFWKDPSNRSKKQWKAGLSKS